MTDSKVVGYIRVSPKIADIDNRIQRMQTATNNDLFIEKGIRGNVPLAERPEFQKLEQQLKAGDTLLIWWMTDFGLGFKGAFDVISELLAKGVSVKTYHQELSFIAEDTTTQALLRLLKGYAEIETQQRLLAAEFGRRKLKGDPKQWQEKFRGRRANHELHKSIAELLQTELTLQAIADQTGASISTVKRVKVKLQHKAEVMVSGNDEQSIQHTPSQDRARKHGYHRHHGRGGHRGKYQAKHQTERAQQIETTDLKESNTLRQRGAE